MYAIALNKKKECELKLSKFIKIFVLNGYKKILKTI